MWTVLTGVLMGSGSMLVGIFVGYALAERGHDKNSSNIGSWD